MSSGAGNCDNGFPHIHMVDNNCLIDNSKEVKEIPNIRYNRVNKDTCSNNGSNFIHLNHHQDRYHT
jgi:hypothetical protein